MSEELPRPAAARDDASPETPVRVADAPPNPPKKDRTTILQEMAPKIAFAMNTIVVLAAVYMGYNFGVVPGLISALIALLYIADDYVDSSKTEDKKPKWSFWGLMIEKFSNLGFLVLATALCLVMLSHEQTKRAEAEQAAQKAEEEKQAAVKDKTTVEGQLAEVSKKVPSPDQVVIEKGQLEKMQLRLAAIDTGTVPVTGGTGDPLKLTPELVAKLVSRPTPKQLILKKQGAGIDWVLTARKGQPGGLLVPPGTASIVIEEKGGEVHVTSTTDISNASYLYLTDGKKAGNSEPLPPVK